MKDKLLKYVGNLLEADNVLPIYEDLVKIFDENELYHEEGGCLEKIWHITQNHDLYRQMGDVFLNKVRNHNIANAAYNRYLQFSQPEFYKNFAENLYQLGNRTFKYEQDNTDYSSKLINLCDRYHAIVYIMILLKTKEEYDAINEAANCLRELKNRINEIVTNSSDDKATAEELTDSDNHLSEVLSEVFHNNEISKLAVELNPENKQAYLNLIEYFIANNNQEEALEYYNNVYAEKFNCPKQEQFDKLCWTISDHYRDCYEFYKAVLFQKYALEAAGASEE